MTLPPVLYYLADRHDRFRLMADGMINAANDGTPWYFTTVEAALDHPESAGLRVFPVPTIETIPGAAAGTRLEDAVDAEATIARAKAGVLV